MITSDNLTDQGGRLSFLLKDCDFLRRVVISAPERTELLHTSINRAIDNKHLGHIVYSIDDEVKNTSDDYPAFKVKFSPNMKQLPSGILRDDKPLRIFIDEVVRLLNGYVNSRPGTVITIGGKTIGDKLTDGIMNLPKYENGTPYSKTLDKIWLTELDKGVGVYVRDSNASKLDNSGEYEINLHGRYLGFSFLLLPYFKDGDLRYNIAGGSFYYNNTGVLINASVSEDVMMKTCYTIFKSGELDKMSINAETVMGINILKLNESNREESLSALADKFAKELENESKKDNAKNNAKQQENKEPVLLEEEQTQ